MCEDEEEREGDFLIFFFFFSLLSQIYGNRTGRFLSEQKEKLDYATRATRRYQNLNISSNFNR